MFCLTLGYLIKVSTGPWESLPGKQEPSLLALP